MNALSFVPVWTVILGHGIFLYVLLDGFDLGVGMLYGFMPDTRSRKLTAAAEKGVDTSRTKRNSGRGLHQSC